MELISDPKWVSFIVKQLLVNALQFTPQDGFIEIQTFRKEHQFILKIINPSDPLSDDQMQRIFQKAYTGRNTSNLRVWACIWCENMSGFRFALSLCMKKI